MRRFIGIFISAGFVAISSFASAVTADDGAALMVWSCPDEGECASEDVAVQAVVDRIAAGELRPSQIFFPEEPAKQLSDGIAYHPVTADEGLAVVSAYLGRKAARNRIEFAACSAGAVMRGLKGEGDTVYSARCALPTGRSMFVCADELAGSFGSTSASDGGVEAIAAFAVEACAGA